MIKTIVFDFGDVFLNLDKQATKVALEKYGISEFSAEMKQKNEAYEMGLIPTRDFVGYYTEKFPQLSEEDFIAAWNSILLDFPKHKLSFLQQLADENIFQLILLSNTNELHIQWVEEHIPFFSEFKACFDAVYLSHEIEMRKPNKDIFEFVLRNHDRNPEEILFIDDTTENTEAAAKLGIQVWNIKPRMEDVVDLFAIHKVLV